MHRLIAEQAGHRAIAAAMRYVDHTTYELERLAAERAAEARRTADPATGVTESLTAAKKFSTALTSDRRASVQVTASRARRLALDSGPLSSGVLQTSSPLGRGSTRSGWSREGRTGAQETK